MMIPLKQGMYNSIGVAYFGAELAKLAVRKLEYVMGKKEAD